jgi:hypothetical protein
MKTYKATAIILSVVLFILISSKTVNASGIDPFFDPGTATAVAVVGTVEISSMVELLEIVGAIRTIKEYLGESQQERTAELLEAVEIQNEIIETQVEITYVLLGMSCLWFVLWVCNQLWRFLWYHFVHVWI